MGYKEPPKRRKRKPVEPGFESPSGCLLIVVLTLSLMSAGCYFRYESAVAYVPKDVMQPKAAMQQYKEKKITGWWIVKEIAVTPITAARDVLIEALETVPGAVVAVRSNRVVYRVRSYELRTFTSGPKSVYTKTSFRGVLAVPSTTDIIVREDFDGEEPE